MTIKQIELRYFISKMQEHSAGRGKETSTYWNDLTESTVCKLWFPQYTSNGRVRTSTHSWFSSSIITNILKKNPKSFDGPFNLTNKIISFLNENEKSKQAKVG